MKLSLITVLVAGLMSVAPAFATAITIDFEGPTSFQSIDQYYNGGTDTAGASGPNLGVSFGLDALDIQNDALGPYFSNAPSPIGVMAPVGADAAMNVAAGFEWASFWYSSIAAGTVDVYSGLNGTGTLLASFSLLNNAQSNGCTDSPFCNWSQETLSWGSKAQSIQFGNAANIAGFDNVKVVPEPGSIALVSIGLAGFAASRRTRRIPAIA